MPFVASISIYPIKSLSPVSVSSARIVECGALEHDREFALFDNEGRYVNGKRCEQIHALHASVDWPRLTITLKSRDRDDARSFHVLDEAPRIGEWLSEFFGMPVCWKQNPNGGFPDDKKATGPTVVGMSTIAAVSDWYPGLTAVETRRRFRANIEIEGAPPFWEDRLYAQAEQYVRFRIGTVEFEGVNPCQRCVVPTRNTQTGVVTPDFAGIFMERRKECLPDWATVSRFNHYYRLAVNTRVPRSEIGKSIRVGDPVEILGVFT